jgi:hypothetical protein
VAIAAHSKTIMLKKITGPAFCANNQFHAVSPSRINNWRQATFLTLSLSQSFSGKLYCTGLTLAYTVPLPWRFSKKQKSPAL